MLAAPAVVGVVHVPYLGSMPALQDMMSDQIGWMFETFSTTLQLHRSGKARILATPTTSAPPSRPERTASFIASELAKWAPVIRSAGVRIE